MRIDTALVVDESYASLAACHLFSLMASASPQTCLNILLGDAGCSRSTLDELTQLIVRPHTLEIRNVKALARRSQSISFSLQDPHYLRLFLPETVTEASRLLYFDVDTIVLRDLAELWVTPLAPYSIAACVDSLETVDRAIANWSELKMHAGDPYFNSGVMLIDISSWQASRVMEETFNTCQENRQHLFAQGRWPQYDQYGLNVALASKWRRLPPYWNHFSFKPPAVETAVIHYLGNSKPWNPSCHPLCRRHFELILKQLPTQIRANLRPV